MGAFTLHCGDCLDVMRGMPSNSVDSIVTDPPYHLTNNGGGPSKNTNNAYSRSKAGAGKTGFMGMDWDGGDIAHNAEVWKEALRVLKPGGYLLAFAGSRTYHRMACAIEDGGFEIRDQIMYLYGSGFPKSHNLNNHRGKTVCGCAKPQPVQTCLQQPELPFEKETTRQSTTWPTCAGCGLSIIPQGLGTALKPAHEPICMARKPLTGTILDNVLAHRTGAINIAGCRVDLNGDYECKANGRPSQTGLGDFYDRTAANQADTVGRWPANLIHDGSPEVVGSFPSSSSKAGKPRGSAQSGNGWGMTKTGAEYNDAGSAARFFYCAKTSKQDRHEGLIAPGKRFKHGATLRQIENMILKGGEKGNNHPTVKPLILMSYLCRLVTPPGGTVLDFFMGSGSTGKAAMYEGFDFIGIDITPEYVELSRARIQHALDQTTSARPNVVTTAEAAA